MYNISFVCRKLKFPLWNCNSIHHQLFRNECDKLYELQTSDFVDWKLGCSADIYSIKYLQTHRQANAWLHCLWAWQIRRNLRQGNSHVLELLSQRSAVCKLITLISQAGAVGMMAHQNYSHGFKLCNFNLWFYCRIVVGGRSTLERSPTIDRFLWKGLSATVMELSC